MILYFSIVLFSIAIMAAVYLVIKNIKTDKMEGFRTAIELYKSGQFNVAEREFEKCVYDSPYNSLFHFYLALTRIINGKHVKAIEPLNEIIKIDNYVIPYGNLPDIERYNKVDILTEILKRYQELKLTDEQIHICYKLMEAEPYNIEHPLRIVQLKHDLGVFDSETKDLLLEALHSHPDHNEAKYQLALWYFKNEHYEDALQTAKPLAINDPDNLKACFIIGESLYKLGVMEEAMGYFSKAARGKEFLKTISYRLGVYNREKGTMDSAFTYARQSVDTPISKFEDPRIDLYSKYFMAELYEATGEYPEALDLYQYVNQVDPTFLEIEEKMKFFKPMGDSRRRVDIDNLSLNAFMETIDTIMDKMNLKIIRTESGSENAVNIIAETKEGSIEKVAIFVRRNTPLIDTDQVELLIKFMDGIRANQGYFISSGSFTSDAVSYMKSVNIKPIPQNALGTYLEAKS